MAKNITSRSLITDAYRQSGIQPLGDSLGDDEINDGLIQLNDLLSQLRMDSNFPESVQVINFQAVTGKIDYWVGTQDAPPIQTTQVVDQSTMLISDVIININYNNWGLDMVFPDPGSPINLNTLCLAINGVTWISPAAYPTTKVYPAPFQVTMGTLLLAPTRPVVANPDWSNVTVGIGYVQAAPISPPPNLFSLQLIPDVPVSGDVVRINSLQVQVGELTWSPLRQVSTQDYYMGSQTPHNATIPSAFTYVRSYPLARISLWNASAQLYPMRMIVAIDINAQTLDEPLNLPNGYASALKWGLASLLAISNGVDNTQMNAIWKQRLYRLKNLQSTPPLLATNAGFLRYSILSDGYVGSAPGPYL